MTSEFDARNRSTQARSFAEYTADPNTPAGDAGPTENVGNFLTEEVLAASSGSSLVGFIQTGDGAEERTTQDKLRDEVSVFDFMTSEQIADVKAGTMTVDTVSFFAAAIATGRPVQVPSGPGWKYKFGSTLFIPSNTTIIGDGRSQIYLADSVDNHVMRIANGADNVEISGLDIDGNKANNTGGHGIATGGTGATNIRVLNNYWHNCSGHGVYFGGTTMSGIQAMHNYCYDNYSGGITGDDTITKFAFNDNLCWDNGTHGVGLLGIGKHGTINDNVCWDNGQGTPNADNITGYNASNENLTVSGNACSGGLNNGIHIGGSLITVIGNVSHNAAQYGIVIWPATSVGDDCVVTGNVAYSSGVSGFWIQNCNSGSVTGNVSRDNTAHGFAIDACANVAFVGNTARGNGGDGFRNETASAWLTFSGNTARNNTGDGIELNNVTDSTITGNTFRSNTGYGINVAGTEARNIISANTVRSNTAGQIAQPATTTRVSENETGVSRTVAADAALTLPPSGEYFYITGTTGITSITASFAERRVTLQFDDALTITDGSNLRMAGNFTTTFQDTITFICDGTNWIECSRSIN